jgi:hypothetical protein
MSESCSSRSKISLPKAEKPLHPFNLHPANGHPWPAIAPIHHHRRTKVVELLGRTLRPFFDEINMHNMVNRERREETILSQVRFSSSQIEAWVQNDQLWR